VLNRIWGSVGRLSIRVSLKSLEQFSPLERMSKTFIRKTGKPSHKNLI
jgi:hypothetical protein